MSQFDDHFAQIAVPALTSYFGDRAKYTPPPGSASADAVDLCNVIVGPEKKLNEYDDRGIALVVERQMQLMTDDRHQQFCGVSNPQRGGVIEYESVEYAIEAVSEGAKHGFQLLKTVRREINRTTHDNYYRKV